jgi:hypothetical protein
MLPLTKIMSDQLPLYHLLHMEQPSRFSNGVLFAHYQLAMNYELALVYNAGLLAFLAC